MLQNMRDKLSMHFCVADSKHLNLPAVLCICAHNAVKNCFAACQHVDTLPTSSMVYAQRSLQHV